MSFSLHFGTPERIEAILPICNEDWFEDVNLCGCVQGMRVFFLAEKTGVTFLHMQMTCFSRIQIENAYETPVKS